MLLQLNALAAGGGTFTDSRERDWKVVTTSYAGVYHEGLAGLMTTSEETEDPFFNATLGNREARAASTLVEFILVMTRRTAALDHVDNAGPGEALTA